MAAIAPSVVLDQFLAALWLRDGCAMGTRVGYQRDLLRFAAWCGRHGVDWTQPTPAALNAYAAELMQQARLRAATVRRALCAIRRFLRWQLDREALTRNPAAGLRLPTTVRAAPKSVPLPLLQQLLDSATPGPAVPATRERWRDYAMLELAYGCGLRVSELVGLRWSRVNLPAGLLVVEGKGRKQRQLPLGEYASAALAAYRQHAYAEFPRQPGVGDIVFLTRLGRAMSRQFFWRRVKEWAAMAGLPPTALSPHVLRHSFASHLVQQGADLRVVQELLGHASIVTTAGYVGLPREHLRQVHRTHHPRG